MTRVKLGASISIEVTEMPSWASVELNAALQLQTTPFYIYFGNVR